MQDRQDSVDRLLSEAFARERRTLPATDMAAQVTGRIRRAARRRALVLAAVGGTGLAVAAASAGPLLTEVLTTVQALLPASWSPDAASPAAAGPVLLATLLLGAAAVLFEESTGL